ncbi:DUF481 domain-containing protein [Thalassotalea mangrovi]|uniref:DUF481 domain-containing protein n=1 Tax=Thalassotalea mangrovi TaxID=2572245 RepID=A0A4U1B4E2_9GAMM|nr:DUF481 domain-containing protein [Thalassotalea mangrovi]TKB45150.1 DUF481 domain-containing protein [Thalassotalea mangrovi]
MHKIISIIGLCALSLPVIAAQDQDSISEANEALVKALYDEKEPTCYNFTDEIPPEQYIALPECNNIPSSYSGAFEVGAFFKTDATNSAFAKTGIDLDHERGKLRTNVRVDMFIRKTKQFDQLTQTEEYRTTDQKWSTNLQSNYTFERGGKNYGFGFASYEDDRFNGYEYQSSVAAGWGRRWYEDDISYFDAEIGPGYKIDEISETATENNRTEKAFIVRTAATYETSVFETILFKQIVSAELAPKADESSKYKSITAFTTDLIGSLALKFAFTVDYNSKVQGNIKKTRTETSLTLVYSI